MTCRAIMIMGTGSDVGKSLVVAGLARAFANRGLRVAPFKPQNMSNNAAVAADGGEIGRAQALQARAARIRPSVHMNPVLLKPESQTGAQVIVQGKRHSTQKAREFFKNRDAFMPAILESFNKIAASVDLILVEGAGSPAEVNLRDGDLANMGFAKAADIAALLVGDIHRGGVIASIIGTYAVLSQSDRARLKGFIINKFHGDPELFDEGRRFLEQHTGQPCLGVIPHFPAANSLPAEDAVALETLHHGNAGGFKIIVLKLPRIANFDDLDPLQSEPGVSVEFITPGTPIPADIKLVIIPGSKSTIADLAALREAGWDIDLKSHVRRGGSVLGLCGGYQMLGRVLHDPDGLEGPSQSVEGLGLLNVETTMAAEKTMVETQAIHALSGTLITAYQIHLGKTTGPNCARLFAQTADGPEGAISANGLVTGTYLHGCFAQDEFRRKFLGHLGAEVSTLNYEQLIEETLDGLAAHLETHLDLDKILALSAEIA